MQERIFNLSVTVLYITYDGLLDPLGLEYATQCYQSIYDKLA